VQHFDLLSLIGTHLAGGGAPLTKYVVLRRCALRAVPGCIVGEYGAGGEVGGMVVIGAVTPVDPDVVGAAVGTVVWK
jgi:hypothetical protein